MSAQASRDNPSTSPIDLQQLRNEVTQISEQLASHSSLLKEFNDLITKKKRFRTDPSPIITTLKQEFKAEFMEDTMRLFTSLEEQLKLMDSNAASSNSKFNDAIIELRRLTDSVNAKANLLQDQANNLRDVSGSLSDEVLYMKDVLALKAEIKDLDNLDHRVDTFTPLENFVILEGTVKQLAYRSEVAKINEEIEIIQDRLNLLPTADKVKESLEKINDELRGLINLKMDCEAYETAVFMINKKQDVFENRIDAILLKTSKDKDSLTKMLNDLTGMFNAKPWMIEIDKINDILETKASSEEFRKLKIDILPKIEDFGNKLDKFSRDLKSFEAAQARFDEIILTKGSKEDIKKIQNFQSTLLKQEVFYSSVSELNIKISSTEEQLKEMLVSIENIIEDINKYGLSSQSQKTQSRDYAALYNSISDLKEAISSKAEKTDLFQISAKMAEKNDFENLKNNCDTLVRQFQQAVQLQSETLKTMLRTADSAIKKDKVRVELSRNTNILLTWINSRLPPVKLDNSVNCGSKLSALLLSRTTPSPDHKIERATPNIWKRSLSRREKRLVISSHAYRASVDLP
ncbi:unnamed protein product [Blepharisma stoltei]|uniref:Uncharacterized protein n=1 Tax=Blepharisma stoltei TaxID=1481888 RepID=A0AAU9JNQ7_9CILI|nr:unnamed protein product [Blepharisma stoltei]